MADFDRYPRDERGYERGRQTNGADRRPDFDRDSLDDRNGYGVGTGYGADHNGGLYNDRARGNYGGGGADYDSPSYRAGREQRSFDQSRTPRPSPRGGTYAYGAEDSGRGYQRQYDPYLGRNDGSESRPFNPYGGEYASEHEERHPRRDGGQDHRGFWDKATDEVSSWMGDRDALARRQADTATSHYGKGPKGYRRSDERIRDEVSDRLSDDHWLDASEIEVNVESGEVTLTGSVSDRDSKRRAERLAESAGGVSDVQNNIRVRPAAGSTEQSSLGVNKALDDQAAGRA